MSSVALTVEEDRRRRMVALYPRTHGPNCPDKYRAIAEWLRLDAEESKNPNEGLGFADNQDALANHMEANPTYYAQKPIDLTDWQWFQRANR